MVRIPGFHCHGPCSIPGLGTEILQATRWPKEKRKGDSSSLLIDIWVATSISYMSKAAVDPLIHRSFSLRWGISVG